MIFETIKTPGLAQISYLIGDDDAGRCAVIDPRRDVDEYLQRARAHEVRITDVLETHIHADFVSGSRVLAERTGATLHVGASEDYRFDHHPLEDGDTVRVGGIELRALRTPGHSPEHMSYEIRGGGSSAREPWGVLTGDTLFAGAVGRPDLAAGGSAEEMARLLHRSVHDTLLPLGDELVVYPGHGAGSPCGADIGARDLTTLGYERRHNDTLDIDDVEAFVDHVLGRLPEQPTYYPRMKEKNAAGEDVPGTLAELRPHAPEEFLDAVEARDGIVLDTRGIDAFASAHIDGALNIALRDPLPIWAGWLLDPEVPVFLVVERPTDLEPVQRHLFRIGIEAVGYLRGGMTSWFEAGLAHERRRDMSVQQLHDVVTNGRDGLQVVDVRSDGEWQSGVIPGATHLFLPELAEDGNGLDARRPVAVYCGSGYRAAIAASLLEQRGFEDVRNVPGSIKAWQAAGYELAQPDEKA